MAISKADWHDTVQVVLTLDCTLSRGAIYDRSSTTDCFNREFTLTPEAPKVHIGRGSQRLHSRGKPESSNAIFDSPIISRQHAELFIDPTSKGNVYIKDLGSMHGTAVNGNRISKFTKTRLKNGDNVMLGETVTQGNKTFYSRSFQIRYRVEPYKRSSVPTARFLGHPKPPKIGESPKSRGTFSVPDSSSSSDSGEEHALDGSAEVKFMFQRIATEQTPRETAFTTAAATSSAIKRKRLPIESLLSPDDQRPSNRKINFSNFIDLTLTDPKDTQPGSSKANAVVVDDNDSLTHMSAQDAAEKLGESKEILPRAISIYSDLDSHSDNDSNDAIDDTVLQESVTAAKLVSPADKYLADKHTQEAFCKTILVAESRDDDLMQTESQAPASSPEVGAVGHVFTPESSVPNSPISSPILPSPATKQSTDTALHASKLDKASPGPLADGLEHMELASKHNDRHTSSAENSTQQTNDTGKDSMMTTSFHTAVPEHDGCSKQPYHSIGEEREKEIDDVSDSLSESDNSENDYLDESDSPARLDEGIFDGHLTPQSMKPASTLKEHVRGPSVDHERLAAASNKAGKNGNSYPANSNPCHYPSMNGGVVFKDYENLPSAYVSSGGGTNSWSGVAPSDTCKPYQYPQYTYSKINYTPQIHTPMPPAPSGPSVNYEYHPLCPVYGLNSGSLSYFPSGTANRFTGSREPVPYRYSRSFGEKTTDTPGTQSFLGNRITDSINASLEQQVKAWTIPSVPKPSIPSVGALSSSQALGKDSKVGQGSLSRLSISSIVRTPSPPAVSALPASSKRTFDQMEADELPLDYDTSYDEGEIQQPVTSTLATVGSEFKTYNSDEISGDGLVTQVPVLTPLSTGVTANAPQALPESTTETETVPSTKRRRLTSSAGPFLLGALMGGVGVFAGLLSLPETLF